jgi:hypothetical protein
MKKIVTNIIISNIKLEPEEKANLHESNIEILTDKIIKYFRD